MKWFKQLEIFWHQIFPLAASPSHPRPPAPAAPPSHISREVGLCLPPGALLLNHQVIPPPSCLSGAILLDHSADVAAA